MQSTGCVIEEEYVGTAQVTETEGFRAHTFGRKERGNEATGVAIWLRKAFLAVANVVAVVAPVRGGLVGRVGLIRVNLGSDSDAAVGCSGCQCEVGQDVAQRRRHPGARPHADRPRHAAEGVVGLWRTQAMCAANTFESSGLFYWSPMKVSCNRIDFWFVPLARMEDGTVSRCCVSVGGGDRLQYIRSSRRADHRPVEIRLPFSVAYASVGSNFSWDLDKILSSRADEAAV